MNVMGIQHTLFQIIKLELKIVFSSANMSTTNYFPPLMAGLCFPSLLITVNTLIATKCHLEIPTVTATAYEKRNFYKCGHKNIE